MDQVSRILFWICAAGIVAEIIEGLTGVIGIRDFGQYLAMAREVLAGGDIYRDVAYTWPPAYPIVFVPFALLSDWSPRTTMALWAGVSLFAFYWTFRESAWLVCRERLTRPWSRSGLPIDSPRVVAVLVVLLPALLDHVSWYQVGLVMTALTLIGVRWISEGRTWRGGLLVGVVAGLKVLPVLLLPYYAVRRQWRTAGGIFVGGLATSVAPILVYGPERWLEFSLRWLEVARSIPGTASLKSVSIFSVFERHVGAGLQAFSGANYLHAPWGPTGVPAVTWWTLGTLLLLFLVALRACREMPAAALGRLRELEVMLVLAAIPLVASLGWVHYMVFQIPLVLWLAHAASGRTGLSEARARALRRALLLATILWFPAAWFALPSRVAAVAQAVSTLTISALTILFAGLYLRAIAAREPGWIATD